MNRTTPAAGRGERREDYLGPDGSWRASHPEGLARVLAKAGYGSRARAEAMIRAGRVAVDGRRVVDPATAVDAGNRLELDGHSLREVPRRYLAWHKPSQLDIRGGGDALAGCLPAATPGLEPVGRLDGRTAGLLLVSNDHWWASSILTRRKLEREFRLVAQGEVGDLEVGIILGGMHLQSLGFVRPAEVKVVARSRESTELRLTLRGGKIRQVRHLFSSLRHEVRELTVVRIAAVRLGDLPVGRCRALTRAEVQALRQG